GHQVLLQIQPSALVRAIPQRDPFYQYGLIIDDRDSNRLLVQRVFPRTPAYYAGLRAGDVITGWDGRSHGAITDLAQALQEPAGNLDLQIARGNASRTLSLDAGEPARLAQRTGVTAPPPSTAAASGTVAPTTSQPIPAGGQAPAAAPTTPTS